MFGRVLVLAGAVAGGGAMAQFPEFSQQYLQRLGGAVQALDKVVADFDTSARSMGLSREAALDQMTGSAFVEQRRADMEATFARHGDLVAALAAWRDTDAVGRLTQLNRMTDPELLRGTWEDFRPALPVTLEGLAFAGGGLVGGGFLVLLLGALVRLLFRRTAAA